VLVFHDGAIVEVLEGDDVTEKGIAAACHRPTGERPEEES
jgi:hypothetical protein